MWLHSVSWIQVYKDGIDTTTGVSKVQKELGGGGVCVGQGLVISLPGYCCFQRERGQQTKTCKDQKESDKNNKQTKPNYLLWRLQREARGCLHFDFASLWPILRLLTHSPLLLPSTLTVTVDTAAVGNCCTWISEVRSSLFPSPFMISFLNTQP